jgi:uncharacterized protein YegP (UPF0339 family)
MKYEWCKLKVEIYKDLKGEFRWRIKARNGKILADSGEGYKRIGAAFRAINLLKYAFWDIKEVK